jgi:aminoglycoside phosphotransferase (APT) family kinase protein
MARVIQAVAGINAVDDAHLRQIKDLRVMTPGVAPIAAGVEAVARQLLADRREESTEVLEQIEAFARAEDRLLARFESLGNRFLTHHDVKPENLIIRAADAPVVVLDWTSARISAPGTGLRLLAGSDQRFLAEVAAHYVECMRRLGHPLALADVIFAVNAHRVFRAFSRGVQKENLNSIREGLRLAQSCRLLEA